MGSRSGPATSKSIARRYRSPWPHPCTASRHRSCPSRSTTLVSARDPRRVQTQAQARRRALKMQASASPTLASSLRSRRPIEVRRLSATSLQTSRWMLSTLRTRQIWLLASRPVPVAFSRFHPLAPPPSTSSPCKEATAWVRLRPRSPCRPTKTARFTKDDPCIRPSASVNPSEDQVSYSPSIREDRQ